MRKLHTAYLLLRLIMGIGCLIFATNEARLMLGPGAATAILLAATTFVLYEELWRDQ